MTRELTTYQALIDPALEAALERYAGGVPASLLEAMRYTLLAPGKRLRPILALFACQAVGGCQRQAVPAACAIEMIHTYSLIHDDLPAMDNDDLRRGLPTCHKKFGEALGILTGDALLTLAFQVLAEGYRPATAAVNIIELAQGAGPAGMVGGQVLDLAAENRIAGEAAPTSLEMLEGIHRRKTGALFRAALRMGYHAAEIDRPKVLVSLDRYGRAFGLAFQITDDLLDVEGSSAEVGKQTGKDAARGKLTYPGLLGIEASRQRAIQLCEEAVAAAEDIGPTAAPLARLARYVVERDR